MNVKHLAQSSTHIMAQSFLLTQAPLEGHWRQSVFPCCDLCPFCLVKLEGRNITVFTLWSQHHRNSGTCPLTEIFPHHKPFHPVPVIFLVNPFRLIFLKQHLAHISHKPISVPCAPNVHILLVLSLEAISHELN